MNVSCPDCRSIFRVDPAKVPPAGVRARCSVCSGVISIPAPTGQNTPASGTGTSRPSSESPQGSSQTPQPTQSGWDTAGFAQPVDRGLSSTSPRRAAPPSPTPSRSIETSGAVRPAEESPDRPSVAATATPPSPASALPEFIPPPPIPPFKPAISSAPMSTPTAGSFSSPAPTPFVPSAPRSPIGPPPSAAPSAPSTPSRPASPESGARRPLNPFLSKDPNQRAKRLARALVSDIITYHPAKHAEGLRDGTLKQLFREEIKKSFEEYIAQVGQQLAESTTYFQEALNEVLGAGKKIF
jgi:predicted Zn finger-like uncharacterized protein